MRVSFEGNGTSGVVPEIEEFLNDLGYVVTLEDEEAGPIATPAAGVLFDSSASITAQVGIELDADGFPWNGQIHAGTAAAPIRTQKGVWKKRRNVDKELVKRVEAAFVASTEPTPAPAQLPLAPATPIPAPAQLPLAPATPAGPIDPFAPVPPATPALPTDPVGACVERASKALGTWGGDEVRRAGIAKRIQDAMAEQGLQGGVDVLLANPDKAPAVLIRLQQLCLECGV